jgi:hypothetical protein
MKKLVSRTVTYRDQPIGYVRQVAGGWVPARAVPKSEGWREGEPVATEELARHIVKDAAKKSCGARFNLVMPAKLKVDLSCAAAERGISATDLAREAIREKLCADEKLAEAVRAAAEMDGVPPREWVDAAVRMRIVSRGGVRDVMVAHYKAGRSAREIAETYGTSREKTLAILRDAGVNLGKADHEVDR